MKPAFLRNINVGAAKYHNKKVTIDGIEFASQKESKTYLELKALRDAGEIDGFERQVTYTLVPAQYEGKKCVERAVTYIADFVVHHLDGEMTVIDAKGMRDQKYPIKRKLMRHVHGIAVHEV